MNLAAPLVSEKVSRCAHRPGQACADVIDVTWHAEAGQARVEIAAPEGNAATVRVSGEVDAASARLVEHVVQRAHAARANQVRLDLSSVSFCDCAGLGAFIVSDQFLRAAGGRLTLSRPSAAVCRLLTLTEMHRVLVLDRPLDD